MAVTEATDAADAADATDAAVLAAHLAGVEAFVAVFDPDRYSVGDCTELHRWFTKQERLMVAVKSLTAARLARGNPHHSSGHRSAAESLAAETGDSVGEVKELMRLGERLADQPELADSLRQGRMSRRRASLVSEATRVNPKRGADLVKTAEHDTDAAVKEQCLRAQAEGRSPGDEARHHRRLHDQRSARTWTDADGALCLHARFAPGPGAELQAALEAQADRQFDQARREGRTESSDAYRADALWALVTGRGILGPEGAGTGTPTGRTPDRRATVSVVVDLESLRRGSVGDGGRCEIPGVGPVPVDHARDLLGEALVELLIAKGTDVTTVYSAGRHVPRRVRSALLLRDPRCVVPGCDARLGLENDHWVTAFAEGGLTSLDNLARICKKHHRDRTHHGFTLSKEGDTWTWTAPPAPVAPRRPKPERRARGGAKGRATGPPPDADPGLFDQAPGRRRE